VLVYLRLSACICGQNLLRHHALLGRGVVGEICLVPDLQVQAARGIVHPLLEVGLFQFVEDFYLDLGEKGCGVISSARNR
jgi:hypothetical protein